MKNELWYIILLIVGFILVYALSCFAETLDIPTNKDTGNYTITYNSAKESLFTDMEPQDIVLCKAIHKAMVLAQLLDKNSGMQDDVIVLLVQYARYKYKETNQTMHFVIYLQSIIDESFTNFTKWQKYYKAFLK